MSLNDEVVPKIQPTAAFVKQVLDLAKAKLEL